MLSSNLLDSFNYVLHRWYDDTEELMFAFEYLKASDFETRKQIAIDVINYLQSVELAND